MLDVPCEELWSGVLPNVFVKASCWMKELYFVEKQ